MKPLCIYHGNCADGFTSAWIVWKALKEEADFHAGVYGNPPPEVTERDVIIVDFSYPRATLEKLAKSARSILILDHHKTASEDLAGFPPPPAWRTWVKMGGYPEMRVAACFDMGRSGAGITWDYFFAPIPRPAFVNHVEDRDLWRFALRNTRQIQAGIFAYPYEFKIWDFLASRSVDDLALEGEAIERKHFKDIRELIEVVTRPMSIGGHTIPVANLPYTLTSDAGNLMSKGRGTDVKPEHPFAGCYWDTPAGRVFSLRSTQGGADVSEIAKQYGGGGHRNASGFRLSYEEAAKLEVGFKIK